MNRSTLFGALTLSLALLATQRAAAAAPTEPAPPTGPGPALPERQEPLPPPPPADDAKAASPDTLAPLLGRSSPFLDPVIGHALLRADYRATWFPEERVSGQPTNLGYVEQDLAVSFPLWQNCTDEWSASASLRSELFHTHALLPDTLQPFPDDLWNVHFATTYRHLFDNGWIAGGTVSVGSASDQPFHGIDEMTAGVHGFLRVPQGEHNAWLFTLAYSSNSQLPFPVPGVAYVWQPSERFRANIGLPLQVMYRPWDDLTLDFSYMLLTNVHARATYRLCAPLRVFAGYDWFEESYLRVDRPSEEDRLFYYDQRLTTGIQYLPCRHVTLEVAAGYVFDRFYFEGRHLSDDHLNRIDVGDGPFASFRCDFRW